MNIKQFSFYFLAIILLSITSLQIDNSLSLSRQWYLLGHLDTKTLFADVFFIHAQLPRLAMTLLIGGIFGVVGSLMQQLTQNNLTSPLTLGTSSGAWLALVIVNIWFTDWVADHSAFAATMGALFAFFLVIIIAGIRNMTGLPLVVSGMVVNILLGAIATALVTLNAQFAQNIFMWGAGDLAQDGWEMFFWLLPRITPVLLIFMFAPRILTLLRLGHEGAMARGLPVLPTFVFFIILSTWLVSVSITVVGVISFIGLLAPNIVRTLGARNCSSRAYCQWLNGNMFITDYR
ncbi:iron chelate uptake ABC transporter family permease subunit [Proteus vulgaris]